MTSDSPCPRHLRVGVLLDDRIVEERHLAARGVVTVGSAAGNTLVLPPAAQLPASLALFEARADGWVLTFDAQLQGRVHLGGAPEQAPVDLTLEALRQGEGPAVRRGAHWVLALPETARGTVRLGAVTLLFQLLAVPAAQAPVATARPGRRRRVARGAAAAALLGVALAGALGATDLLRRDAPQASQGRTPPPAAPRVLVHAPAAAVRPPLPHETAAWRKAESARRAPAAPADAGVLAPAGPTAGVR